MILIADSGSTKTDWLIHQDGQSRIIKTDGLNPFMIKDDQVILQVLKEQVKPELKSEPEAVYFYGTGCINEQMNEYLKGFFRQVFTSSEISIKTDLLGAARAMLGREEGIACILGTGSNCCFYNGKEIVESVPSLGFILGDFGSGAHLGKLLVSDYLKGFLPQDLKDAFDETFRYSYNDYLELIYRQPRPNRFLASFTRFLEGQKHHPYVKALLSRSFSTFIEQNVSRLHVSHNHQVHFTGSIAYYFREELEISCWRAGFEIGNVIKSPIEHLLQYHLTKS